MPESERLAHVLKYSAENYENKLIQILEKRMGSKEEAVKYRETFISAFSEDSACGEVLQADTTFPNTISVNINNKCNFNCMMCDVPGNNAKAGDLSIDDIQMFFSQITKIDEVKCCILGSGSEITLHPEWKKIVTLATSYFPDVILFTNGSTLVKNASDFILDSGITRLFISLDAASPQLFKKIRGHDLLEKIESSIDYITRQKNALNQNHPLLRVSFVNQIDNHHELDEFVQKWIHKVDSVEIQDYVEARQFRDRNYIQNLEPLTPEKLEKISESHCHYPFSYLSVWADGSVGPCCTSYSRDSEGLKLGTVHDPIDQIMDKLHNLQNLMNDKNPDKLPVACQHCLYAQTIDSIAA
ncbi:radical SAM protein [Synechococcus sp. HB1133]|uniref:radical SAM/SPASM domain-containing protein n=1 Tax=unclassified Synechococcus TaxID=2626047 RepID=UPI00140E6944|nr:MULTISPECIES: radical SAM/SPASM domain-containing protein [unclassified Synechococcus]MCB4421660.1 radical SAM protein [Synechococcus sp. HB1133]MCB4430988.1 radical SAM protein [Synechococcus sp. HBA1120]NHI80602.1 radical SAM protein [Synechococcus sp. HB1133]